MAISRSSGSLSTDGMIGSTSGSGLLCGAQAIGGTVDLYNGSTLGTLLATITSSGYHNFANPISYGSSGLHVQISAGTAVVHYT
jgi:hypothetical protein